MYKLAIPKKLRRKTCRIWKLWMHPALVFVGKGVDGDDDGYRVEAGSLVGLTLGVELGNSGNPPPLQTYII